MQSGDGAKGTLHVGAIRDEKHRLQDHQPRNREHQQAGPDRHPAIPSDQDQQERHKKEEGAVHASVPEEPRGVGEHPETGQEHLDNHHGDQQIDPVLEDPARQLAVSVHRHRR